MYNGIQINIDNYCYLWSVMLQEHEVNRLLLENLQSVIYLCKFDAYFSPLRLNGQIEAMSGYQVDAFMSGEVKIPDLYHPDEREMIFREVQKAAEENRAYHLVHRMRHRDGSWVWVESVGKLIVNENDPEDCYISGFLIDITDRKRMQDELRKLSEIVQHSPASVVVTDHTGKIEYVNPKFEEITGYSYEEAIGKNPSILKSGYQLDAYYQGLWETIQSGKEWRGEFSNKKKNGEIYWELASISPIVNDGGKIESFVAVKEDITDRKNAEQALEEAKDALEEQVLALQQRNRQIALFSEMQEALLNCEEEIEAHHVLAASAAQLFPHISGNLFEVAADKKTALLTGWGGICNTAPDFPLLERIYAESHDGEKITRPFFSECMIGESGTDTGQTLYIPLFTQGILWGFFQLVLASGQQVDEVEQLAVSVAQQYLLDCGKLALAGKAARAGYS